MALPESGPEHKRASPARPHGEFYERLRALHPSCSTEDVLAVFHLLERETGLPEIVRRAELPTLLLSDYYYRSRSPIEVRTVLVFEPSIDTERFSYRLRTAEKDLSDEQRALLERSKHEVAGDLAMSALAPHSFDPASLESAYSEIGVIKAASVERFPDVMPAEQKRVLRWCNHFHAELQGQCRQLFERACRAHAWWSRWPLRSLSSVHEEWSEEIQWIQQNSRAVDYYRYTVQTQCFNVLFGKNKLLLAPEDVRSVSGYIADIIENARTRMNRLLWWSKQPAWKPLEPPADEDA